MIKKFILENLDCANCANKLERKINTLEEVKEATIDFMKLTLILECESEELMEIAIEKSRKIIKDLEPGVNMIPYKKGHKMKKEHHHEHHEHHHEECGCGHHHEHHEHHHEECGCGHHHGGKKTNKVIDFVKSKTKLILMIVSFIIFLIPTIFTLDNVLEIVLYVIAYLFVGYEILWKSIKNISKGEVFDENFLMSIASIVAFIIGEYMEAYAVMLFYQIGEYLQDVAVEKSRRSISSMMDLKVEKANLLIDGEIEEVECEEVSIDDIIVVKVGEQVPLDGEIIEGECVLDSSTLTGESIPLVKKVGDEVLSGMINKDGIIKVKVTKEYEDSTLSKILDLVENATSKKSSSEKFITKFAKVYTPIVCLLALLIAVVPLFFNGTFEVWGYRACVFLVTSCPCALVVSVPLSYFVGIGSASKAGVLVKGSNYLEELNNIKKIYFDKTGTLTKGEFKVEKVCPNKISEKELLEIASSVETLSNHPISKSIKNAARIEIDLSRIKDYKEVAGKGVEALIDGHFVKAGNYEFINKEIAKANEIGTVIYVSKDDEYLGYLVIRDAIKENAKEAILDIKNQGLKTVMLTGDQESIAKFVSNEVGVDECYYELLPIDKVNKVKEDNENVAFVGDGINDAPALMASNVGIAMGGLGSDAAIESSDVVLMKDNLDSLIDALKIAKKTRKIVLQNIIFSLAIKSIIMVLGAIGISTLWMAVFADVGVTLLAVLNSLRVMKY